jgi:ATP-dependent Clp protease protease subunit
MSRVTRDDIEKFHEHGIYYPNRTLFISGEIDDKSAAEFIKNLHILCSAGVASVTVYLCSPGGEVDPGMAIYDAIRNSTAPVDIIGMGCVNSMASVILQAGTKRLLSPNCRMMLHYGTTGVEEVHTKDFIKLANAEDKLCKVMEDIYLERIRQKVPGYAVSTLRRTISNDLWLTAREALDLGLCDSLT